MSNTPFSSKLQPNRLDSCNFARIEMAKLSYKNLSEKSTRKPLW